MPQLEVGQTTIERLTQKLLGGILWIFRLRQISLTKMPDANKNCVIAQLDELKIKLRCAENDQLKKDALRFAVHFVGDIQSHLLDIMMIAHIGQLWIHHTGHDASRGYGTKTREWGMDTVAHLTAAKRPDTDVSFHLRFTKARERTPLNRLDFQEISIALVNDEWIGSAAAIGKMKIEPLTTKFFEALRDATIDCAAKMHGCPAAPLDRWRAECVRRGLIGPKAKAHIARSMSGSTS